MEQNAQEKKATKGQKRKVEINLVAVDLLVSNKDNPRKISHIKYKELKDSIQSSPEFMELNPIIVNEDNIVLSGNQRLMACKELGWTEVPVIHAFNLSEKKQKELMYKLNHHSGQDDEIKLFDLFSEEELLSFGHEFKKSHFEVEMGKIGDGDAEMPITPRFDEKYGCVVIVFKTDNEKAYLETQLDIEKSKAYNSKYVGYSYVMTFEKFVDQWKKNTEK